MARKIFDGQPRAYSGESWQYLPAIPGLHRCPEETPRCHAHLGHDRSLMCSLASGHLGDHIRLAQGYGRAPRNTILAQWKRCPRDLSGV